MCQVRYSIALKLGASGVAILYSASAFAQSAAIIEQSSGSETSADIVVTAQKRSERLQDVPLSVQAITSATLAKTGADTTQSLQNIVPGLNVSDNAAGFKPFIRGVGSATSAAGNENSVSTYIDNIYLASMNGGLLNLASIESIEVLKGPQGTLFGRNATGGVINIRTKDPSHDLSGSASVKYDNYKTVIATGYLTGGLSENLAADLALYFRDQGDGYGINLHTGNDANWENGLTIRSKLLFTPSDTDKITLAGDYSRTKSSGQNYRAISGTTIPWGGNNPALQFGGPYSFPSTGGTWDIDQAIDPRYRQWAWGVSLTYEHEFEWATLSSFTAYRKSEVDQAWNATPIPVNAQYAGWIQPEHQFSQELQLGSAPNSPVKWIVGAYYINAQVKYDPFFISGLSLAPNQQQFNMKQKIKSPALYGQFTAPIEALGETHVTGGLRYTIDKRSIIGNIEVVPQVTPSGPVLDTTTIVRTLNPTDASKTFKTFTWRLGVDHRFSQNTMVYATYNRGFKAGSYNSIPPGGPNTKPTNPEYLDAYEIGVKNTFADSRVAANISAFYYNYKDLQVTIFNQGTAQTVNAARARIKGIDVDITAQLTRTLRLTFGGELLDHKFLKYPNGPILTPLTAAQGGGVIRTFGDLSGKPLPYTAKRAFTVGVDYNQPTAVGTIDAYLGFSYNSGYSFEPSDAVARGSITDLSGSIGFTLNNETTRISVFGKNIANEANPKIVATGGNPGGYLEIQYRPPRTYGVGISQKF